MADGTVAINPGAGVLIDTDQVTVGANTVERQRVRLSGSAAGELAEVRNSSPATTDYGQVVRLPGPVGQDFGTVVTPEVGRIYISAKSRAAVTSAVFNQSVTAATGVSLISGVASLKVYLFQVTLTTDTLSTFYFRTGNVAGGIVYLVRLAAGGSIAIAAPMGTYLAETIAGQALFFDCSATATIAMSILWAQV